MSLGKKVADIGYKSFTVSMLMLTGYGGFLVCRRISNFVRNRNQAANTGPAAIEMPAELATETKQ